MAPTNKPEPTAAAPPELPAEDGAGRRTYFGRQGSPEITVAFPFAKVEVTKADDALRPFMVATVQALDVLAEQVHELARAGSKAERAAVADAIAALRTDLDDLITQAATAAE